MKIVSVTVVDGGKSKKGKKLDPRFVGHYGCDCGREVSREYRFCPHCGKPVQFKEDIEFSASEILPKVSSAIIREMNERVAARKAAPIVTKEENSSEPSVPDPFLG